MTLLTVNSISKTFGHGERAVHAVRNVTLSVQSGECLAVVGESGSGKTTLANVILGVLAPSAGQILFEGSPLPIRRTPMQRRAIQFVQQNPLSALNPKRTVGASIRLGLDTYGIGASAQRWAQVEATLADVGLPPELRHRPPSALSGGQRQRVGIARALAVEPRLVVLDEPTSALDVLVQARVLALLNRLRAEHALTYVFITHDLAVVRNVADRVAVFRNGELVELAAVEEVFTAPRHPYTRSLIGAVPVVDTDELALREKLAAAP